MTESMVRKGSPVRVRQRASASHREIRELAEATQEPQPMKNPASDFDAAAQAYAAGHIVTGNRLFDKAWRRFTPTARGVVYSTLRNPDLVDDAMQVAAMKLVGAMRRGYQPTSGWTAIARVACQNASKDVLTRCARRCDEYPLLDDDTARDAAEYRAQQLMPQAEDDRMVFENLAAECIRRGGRTMGPLWASMIMLVGEGCVELEQIAKTLNRPAGTIRRAAYQLRQTDIFDSIQGREVVVTWRDVDVATTPDRLFDFAYTG